MNRAYRRALARLEHRIIRERHEKHSYKLLPQRCALWVPDMGGYLVEFSPCSFRVVNFAELARHYGEDEAASAALTFREITGLRVAVRPVYLQRAGRQCPGLLP